MNVQDAISRLHQERGAAALAKVARAFLRDEESPSDEAMRTLIEHCAGDRIRCQRGLLRWAVSDLPEARSQWEILERAKYADLPPTRDRYVERVWKEVAAKPETGLHANLVKLDLFEPYRAALFTWFLRRFDLFAALRLYTTTTQRARWVLLGLPGAVLVISVLALLQVPAIVDRAPRLLAALAASGLAALFLWFFSKLADHPPPLLAFSQLFVPRLLAAVAIGYFFLGAAWELMVFLVGWPRHWALPVAAAVAILAATWLFTFLHVARRIHPTPRPREVARRASMMLWMGAAHSALLLPAAACVLFSPGYLNLPGPDPQAWVQAPAWPSYLLVAALALALGMALELAWEEKPLTEPL